MKAITIRQPWAAWIFTPHPGRGTIKDVENRTWQTRHRGPLAVHAGIKLARDEMSEGEWWTHAHPLKRQGIDPVWQRAAEVEPAWTRGAIIGLVDLIDIEPSESPWAITVGHYHWRLANPRLLPTPIPYPGRPGIFDVPDHLIQKEIRSC